MFWILFYKIWYGLSSPNQWLPCDLEDSGVLNSSSFWKYHHPWAPKIATPKNHRGRWKAMKPFQGTNESISPEKNGIFESMMFQTSRERWPPMFPRSLEGTYFPQTKNAKLNWLGLELWSWATGDSDLVKGPGGWFDKSAGKVDKTEQIKKWIKYRFPKHGRGD